MRVAMEKKATCVYRVQMKETTGSKATPQFMSVYDCVEGTPTKFCCTCVCRFCSFWFAMPPLLGSVSNTEHWHSFSFQNASPRMVEGGAMRR